MRVGCACRDRNGQADGVTYRDGRRTVARRSSEAHRPTARGAGTDGARLRGCLSIIRQRTRRGSYALKVAHGCGALPRSARRGRRKVACDRLRLLPSRRRTGRATGGTGARGAQGQADGTAHGTDAPQAARGGETARGAGTDGARLRGCLSRSKRTGRRRDARRRTAHRTRRRRRDGARSRDGRRTVARLPVDHPAAHRARGLRALKVARCACRDRSGQATA